MTVLELSRFGYNVDFQLPGHSEIYRDIPPGGKELPLTKEMRTRK
jgi:hypothetical protein